MDKTPSEEFEFIRGKLERIARMLVDNSNSAIIEAAFMIGCLHSVCNENVEKFKDFQCITDTHD